MSSAESNTKTNPNDVDTLTSPFIFVPQGEPVPDALRGPEWIRIPATFVPHATVDADHSAPGNAPVPRWQGAPPVPRGGMPPDQRRPGEAVDEAADPVATYLAMEQVFRDPAKAAGIVPVAGGERAGGSVPNAPAVPDRQWLRTDEQATSVTFDIYVGGYLDETLNSAVLPFAEVNKNQDGHTTVYSPWTTNTEALAKYIDGLPAGARINLIGHS